MSYIAFNNILSKMMITNLVYEDNFFMNAGHEMKFVWVSFWFHRGSILFFIYERSLFMQNQQLKF